MYTTFGAPSGALGGSNGDQSGSESRMSTLIVPLNGSAIEGLLCWIGAGNAAGRSSRRIPCQQSEPDRALVPHPNGMIG